MLKPGMMCLTQYGTTLAENEIILTGTLANAVLGSSYSSSYTLIGGTSPFTYSVSSGSLPGGLSLNTSTGVISGTLTGTTSAFNLHVVDSLGLTTDKSSVIAEADASFASVVTLLGLDGTAASTTFTDDSSFAVAYTATGNAQLGTTHKKFGSAALLLDANGDSISAISSHLNLNNKAYTIEGWAYLDQTTYSTNGKSFQCLFGNYTTAGDGRLTIVMNSSGQLLGLEQDGGGGGSLVTTTTASIPKQTWFHFALTRDLATSSGKIYVFIDGVLSATSSAQAAKTSYSTASGVGPTFRWGTFINAVGADSDEWNGSLDELRITAGVCRYTSTFTPRTVPFPRA